MMKIGPVSLDLLDTLAYQRQPITIRNLADEIGARYMLCYEAVNRLRARALIECVEPYRWGPHGRMAATWAITRTGRVALARRLASGRLPGVPSRALPNTPSRL